MIDMPEASVQSATSCFCTVKAALYSVACSGVNVPFAGKVRAGGWHEAIDSEEGTH